MKHFFLIVLKKNKAQIEEPMYAAYLHFGY